ncbi:MAG: glycosyltransferase family 4 protein [Devosia sp.]
MTGRPLVFVWENFGPYHVDRTEAVARANGGARPVVGLELRERSVDYSWDSASSALFKKITLSKAGERLGLLSKLGRLMSAARVAGRGDYFLCHYHYAEMFLFAIWLRLTGSRAFAMFESKFDDRPRRLWQEVIKSWLFMPYNGALYGSPRSREYLRFLGFHDRRLASGYDAVSVERIRLSSGSEIAPGGVAFSERDFVSVARLVEKKNLRVLIHAYAQYAAAVVDPRGLKLLGDGPLEAELKDLAVHLGVADKVTFRGFVQTAEVAHVLSNSLALLLPSIEEQFGLVVIEAMALGLPVVVSDNVGARDELVRSQVNGFVVEPDNVEGLARAMVALSGDEGRWAGMCRNSTELVSAGDVARFAEGVARLAGGAAPVRP